VPVDTIPFIGSPTQRGYPSTASYTAGKDQRFINFCAKLVKNPVTGKGRIKAAKRPGVSQIASIALGSGTVVVMEPWIGNTVVGGANAGLLAIARGTTSQILLAYTKGTSVYDLGAITGEATGICDGKVSTTPAIFISSSDSTGWYYCQDAGDLNSGDIAFAGDTTNTSTTINNIASTTGMYPGQSVSGSGIPANTRIATVASSTSITITNAATATAAGVTITRSALAKIIDADFPGNAGKSLVGTFVQLDGFLFIMDSTGAIWNSDVNSVVNWVSTSFLDAGLYPDGGVGLARVNDLIVGLGKASVEFFRNAGNTTGSPLSRINSMALNIGAINAAWIKTVGPRIFWKSRSAYGDIGIWMWAGGQARRISTPIVEGDLQNVVGTELIFSAVHLNGYTLLTIYRVGQSRSHVYNVDLDWWSEWSGDKAVFFASSDSATNIAVCDATSSPKYGYIANGTAGFGNALTWQDHGSAFTATIQTDKIDHGTTKRKFYKRLRLISDTVTSGGNCSVSYSDDDYASFSTARTIDTSAKRKELTRLGSTEFGRAWKFEHSANAAFEVDAFEIEYEVGT